MSKRIRGYNVYRNGNWQSFVEGRNRALRNRVAADLVGMNTHMGNWSRERGLNPEGIERPTVFHYTYNTSIGVYIDFRPAWRSEAT